jgi:two-component system, cell cycle sensor histidine kinase and response regulator CckA
MLTEITESKKVVDALRASEEFCRNLFDQANRQEEPYKALLNCSSDPIILYDIEGKVQYLNPAHSKLFGWTLEEARGKRLNTLPDWDREATLAIISQILTEGAMNQSYDTQRLSKQGQLIDVSVSGARFLDHNGNPAGMLVILHDITERKAIDKALKQSEEKYRRLVETTTDWVWSLDAEGHHTYGNPAIEKLLGYKVKEIVGSSAFQFIHPDDAKPVKEIVQRCIEQRRGWHNLEIRWLHKDGSTRLFESSATPILDERDTVIGFNGVDRDITERKHAENELRQSEARFRSYFELPLIGIAITSVDKDWLEVNSTLCDMLGYSRQELTGMTWTQLTHPDDLDPDLAQFNRMIGGQIDNYSMEKRFIRKDGDIVWTDLSVGCVRKPDGAVDYVVALFQNITLRKKTQEDLKTSEERYRQLADVTFEGIIFHHQGVLLRANDQFFEMFGYEPGELVGTQIMEKTLTPESVKTVRAHIAERSTESYLATGLRKDGSTFPIEIRARMREIDGKMIRATAIRDISMLKSLEIQLIHAQKMEAIGTLAGGFAHDFRNMLQVVLGSLELIEFNKDLPEKFRTDLDRIRKAATSGAELVKGMLVFSRKTSVKLEPLNLNNLVVHVESLLTRSIPKMINIEVLKDPDLFSINGDSTQMEQVLMNLGVNASHAMADGGTLTIQTQNTVLDEKFCLAHSDTRPGRYVLLSVADTGTGMNEETVRCIFEPFFTTKEKGKGTGLGLAVVYGIVEQHGATIICESKPSVGTTFKIYFPAVEEIQEEKYLENKGPPMGQGETILMVDDAPEILEMGALRLNGSNYNVITASNAKEAIKMYEKHRNQIRLVLMDLIMPEMGGVRCLEILRKMDPDVKILVLTGYTKRGITQELKEAGARDFILKPFDTPQLLEKIREIIDEK